MKLILFLISLGIFGLAIGDQDEAQKPQTKANWCCSINPPSKPILTHDGHLIGYDPQPCPSQYLVCCNGYLNILGNCLHFNEIPDFLSSWQTVANSLGISVQQAITMLGGSTVG